MRMRIARTHTKSAHDWQIYIEKTKIHFHGFYNLVVFIMKLVEF